MTSSLGVLELPEGYALERYVASQPFLTDKYSMKCDGEWHITYEVYSDMGIAFASLIGIINISVI